ncbi:MAG: hypothetical protein KGL65_02540 [Rhodospirillales bacterium]|nr:hypothetical protein [Rhodospirillales bacterium]
MSLMVAAQPSPWKRPALLLGLLTLLFCLPLLWRALAPVQFDSDEGWNVARAMMAAHDVPLYGQPPGLDFTNYPFLSFHLLGWLVALGFDPLFAGRGLALASLLVVGGLAGALARLFTAQAYAALFAAILFVLWLSIWMPNRVALDDPQLFGMVLEAAGFYVFVRGGTFALRLSAYLFILALFIKQSLIALPIGAGLSLMLQRRWRDLFNWLLAGALGGGLLLWLTLRRDGPFFFANLLAPRAYIWRDLGSQGGDYLLVFLPALVLAGLWCQRHWRQQRAQPFILAWLAANALGFAFAGGDGVGRNVFFEAVLLNTVLAMAECAEAPRSWRAVLLLFPLVWAPAHFISVLHEDQALPRARADFAAGVAALKAVQGPVVCENLLLCARAGHVPAFSPYFVESQLRLGRISPAAITAMLPGLKAVEIGTTDLPDPPRDVMYPPSFLAALKQNDRLILARPSLAIWVPRH